MKVFKKFEENKRKEAKILEDLQRLVHSTLGTQDEGGDDDSNADVGPQLE